MKKLLGIAVGVLSAVGLCAEDVVSDLTLETNVQFQTERVFRGRNEFHKTLAPKVKVGSLVCDGYDIYAGIDAWLDIASKSAFNRISPNIGVSWDVAEIFTLDGGYKHHFHTAMPKEVKKGDELVSGKRDSGEIYGGVIVDVLLEPSLYCFYDFGRKEFAIEGRVLYNVDLSQYAFSGLGIDLGAKVGFDHSSKPNGLSYIETLGKKSYSYYGVNADLIYELSNNAKAKFGLAYEGNSAEQQSWVNGVQDRGVIPGYRNSLWINASVDCSF
ncbi:MAG: hypothetical protein LBC30_00500 [Puniceicoccales bacterium]|jgi:hypothetical protein|nr:hypothetical protein [Puniceicoccales bacterium]